MTAFQHFLWLYNFTYCLLWHTKAVTPCPSMGQCYNLGQFDKILGLKLLRQYRF